MTDRELLISIHERLEDVHKDSRLSGWMHRLRAIIASTPAGRETPDDGRGKNSLKELVEDLKKREASE